MMSSTKLEVRNIVHYCHRTERSEPQPQVGLTCTENFMKFGRDYEQNLNVETL